MGWKGCWATYYLVTLGKSFTLLGPSILITKVREVGWNLAARFSLDVFVMGHS